MRKHQFEALLAEAIVLEAEEQGERLNREPQAEQIPEEAQARFDAALYGKQKTEQTMRRRAAVRRAIGYAMGGVGAVAAILLILLVFGMPRSHKPIIPDTPDKPEEPAVHESTDAPQEPGAVPLTAEPTQDPVEMPEQGDEPPSVEAWTPTIRAALASGYPAWDVETPDDGWGGIGTVRGNTNGTLHNKGRTLQDETQVFYVDRESNPVRICRYDAVTNEIRVLVAFDRSKSSADVGYLNLIGSDLYFATGLADGDVSTVYRLSTVDRTVQRIGDCKALCFFLAAYDRLLISDAYGTSVCDANGVETVRMDGYWLSGAMDGVLYGYRADAEGCFAVDLDGNPVDHYDAVTDPIPAYGVLLELQTENVVRGEYNVVARLNMEKINPKRGYEDSRFHSLPLRGFEEDVKKRHTFLGSFGYEANGDIFLNIWKSYTDQRANMSHFTPGFNMFGEEVYDLQIPDDAIFVMQTDG